MIKVTTLKGVPFYLNIDLIYRIDEVPDTIITLVDGKKIWVKETPEEVVRRIWQYQKSLYSGGIRVAKMEDTNE